MQGKCNFLVYGIKLKVAIWGCHCESALLVVALRLFLSCFFFPETLKQMGEGRIWELVHTHRHVHSRERKFVFLKKSESLASSLCGHGWLASSSYLFICFQRDIFFSFHGFLSLLGFLLFFLLLFFFSRFFHRLKIFTRICLLVK